MTFYDFYGFIIYNFVLFIRFGEQQEVYQLIKICTLFFIYFLSVNTFLIRKRAPIKIKNQNGLWLITNINLLFSIIKYTVFKVFNLSYYSYLTLVFKSLFFFSFFINLAIYNCIGWWNINLHSFNLTKKHHGEWFSGKLSSHLLFEKVSMSIRVQFYKLFFLIQIIIKITII